MPEEVADRDNDAWFQEHFVELVGKYPRQWIAVVDGGVVGSSITKDDAEAAARTRARGRAFSLYFVPGTPFR